MKRAGNYWQQPQRLNRNNLRRVVQFLQKWSPAKFLSLQQLTLKLTTLIHLFYYDELVVLQPHYDRRLCVVTYTKAYLKRTKSIRQKGETHLLISYKKPHQSVSRNTLKRWTKQTVTLATTQRRPSPKLKR